MKMINVFFQLQEAEADLKAGEECDRDFHWSQSITKYVESSHKGAVGPQM